jgi:predicted DCC family thiol-disulfide oxidoreductase YuxK
MSERIHVIYDGDCQFCTNSMQWLQKKDRKGILEFTPLQDPEVLIRFDIPYQEAMSEMQAIIDGTRYRGAEAVIRVIGHLPGYQWLRAGLRFRWFMLLASIVYKQFAKRRRMFTRK